MTLSGRLRVGIGVVALCCSVAVTSSCSLGPNDLPSGRGIGDSYQVTLQFASMMNLPTGADVVMDGLRVGMVDNVDVSNSFATVGLELKAGTKVPADVRAVIRQDTLLGDTYIAFDKDPNSAVAADLQAGDTVPVGRTTSPPPLEDTLAVLAYFVNGGSIQKIQDAMSGINKVMPALPDVQNLASTVARDLQDLSQNTNEIDRILDGFNATAETLNDNGSTLSLLFAEPGVHYWDRLSHSMIGYIAEVLPSIGSIFSGGMWMVPMLDSLANTGGEIRGIYDIASSGKLTSFCNRVWGHTSSILRLTFVRSRTPMVNKLSATLKMCCACWEP